MFPELGDPGEILGRGFDTGEVLEEFGPVWNSARARIARESWWAMGADPFLSYEVPYTGTSSGRLSEDAVTVFLAAAEASGRASGLRCLEIGSGSGVFAKLFLDCLKSRAPDIYAETLYRVSDRSDRMLGEQRARGLFKDHEGRVEWAVLDASAAWDAEDRYDAIFATYVLDSMPFDLLAVNDGRIWRKEVRSVLDGAEPGKVAALREALASGDEAALRPFARLGMRIALQTRHVPLERAQCPRAETLQNDTAGATLPVMHSWGAVDCLERCLDALRPGGVMVFSDYGHTEPLQAHESAEFQSFGASIAAGLNYPQLDRAFAGRQDARLFKPLKETGGIVTRVLAKAPVAGLGPLVDDLYGHIRTEAMTLPRETARELVRGRMFQTARGLYMRAFDLEPRNWSLIEEAAMLFQGGAGEHDIALELCEIGLRLNPLAPGLWRIVATAHLAHGEHAAARAALDTALGLAPTSPQILSTRAELEIACGDYRAALLAIAEALAADLEGDEQETLIALQNQALGGIAAEQRLLLLAQANGFRDLDRLPKP